VRTKSAIYWLSTIKGYRWHFAKAVTQTKGGILMETPQQVMYAFYAVLMLAAAGIAAWLWKKREENDTDIIF